MLDLATLERALLRLNGLAGERGIKVKLVVYGGAIMMSQYGARRRTRDIDATYHPKEQVAELIRQIATELDLPSDWLNDDVRMWLAENPTDGLQDFSAVSF